MIDKDTPPAFFSFVFYWERSSDPWHPDAFPDELKGAIPNQTSVRKEGWMAIDGVENPIGFYPDGMDVELADEFVMREGPYGRLCAYRD